ncbi:hypothetical protein SAY86_002927 [Trapa natans]|uniref:Lipoyl synthase N-terminal domain-containing protein n=1 Tax=Trapa natans TaxID=22666 RepID=A0AAN7LE31_TRANT|nr:hypothetical protein SAY86_002927 [Trapa natans]
MLAPLFQVQLLWTFLDILKKVSRGNLLSKLYSERSSTSPSSECGAPNLTESKGSAKRGRYPGGTMGPYTGRDSNLKKPGWLRQRAPQGHRFNEVKESLSRLNLNTVCEEA